MTDAQLQAALLVMTNIHGVMTERAILRAPEQHRFETARALIERGRSFAEMMRPPEFSSQKLTARGYRKRRGLLYEMWWIPPQPPEPEKKKRKRKTKSDA